MNDGKELVNGPRVIAYADPPYLGQGAKHYPENPFSTVYDTVEGHKVLIDRLVSEFPDGWAMSASSPSLRTLLPLCPEDVRVAAWVKPFASFKPNMNPGYAWEPVIFRGGRKRDREEPTIRDYCSSNITLETGTHGAKPERFCFWLFDLMGLRPWKDELVDLFPGSGAVQRAWEHFKAQGRLAV